MFVLFGSVEAVCVLSGMVSLSSVSPVAAALVVLIVVVASVPVRSPGLCADDLRSLPAPVGPAAGGGDVALEEAFGALVAYDCMDVIVRPPTTYQMGVLHSRRGPTQHCAFLADVGQVVVAGHVVPLAILMGNGHHAVLASCEEVVRLALPPVLIYQIVAVRPLKVLLHGAVIQSDPGVVVTKTVDKLLLCDGDDTTEVGAVLSAVFFCILPGVSVGEVPVAVAVELPPAVLAAFDVFLACVSSIARQAKAEEGINLVDASASIFTWL